LADPADVDKLARQDAAHKKRRASWGLKWVKSYISFMVGPISLSRGKKLSLI
jgi:hypothetical protein